MYPSCDRETSKRRVEPIGVGVGGGNGFKSKLHPYCLGLGEYGTLFFGEAAMDFVRKQAGKRYHSALTHTVTLALTAFKTVFRICRSYRLL